LARLAISLIRARPVIGHLLHQNTSNKSILSHASHQNSSNMKVASDFSWLLAASAMLSNGGSQAQRWRLI
jgi:hypothetical protein